VQHVRRTAEPCWSTRRRARRWCSHGELIGTVLDVEGGQVQHSGLPIAAPPPTHPGRLLPADSAQQRRADLRSDTQPRTRPAHRRRLGHIIEQPSGGRMSECSLRRSSPCPVSACSGVQWRVCRCPVCGCPVSARLVSASDPVRARVGSWNVGAAGQRLAVGTGQLRRGRPPCPRAARLSAQAGCGGSWRRSCWVARRVVGVHGKERGAREARPSGCGCARVVVGVVGAGSPALRPL
jgi:hypothetical protein